MEMPLEPPSVEVKKLLYRMKTITAYRSRETKALIELRQAVGIQHPAISPRVKRTLHPASVQNNAIASRPPPSKRMQPRTISVHPHHLVHRPVNSPAIPDLLSEKEAMKEEDKARCESQISQLNLRFCLTLQASERHLSPREIQKRRQFDTPEEKSTRELMIHIDRLNSKNIPCPDSNSEAEEELRLVMKDMPRRVSMLPPPDVVEKNAQKSSNVMNYRRRSAITGAADAIVLRIPIPIRRLFNSFCMSKDTSNPKSSETDCLASSPQGLDPDEFAAAFCQHFQFNDKRWCKHLFHVLNATKSGRMSLPEFHLGLRQLSSEGSDDEKIALVFGIFDPDMSGTLDLHDVFHRLHAGSSDTWEDVVFHEKLMNHFDQDKNGQINFAEFTKACKEVPLFFKCFAGSLPVSISTVKKSVRSNLGISVRDLTKIWTSGVYASQQNDDMMDCINYRGFRAMMSILFRMQKTNRLDQCLCARVYEGLDRQQCGVLYFDDFMQGISALFHGPTRERATRLFEILDTHGRGKICRRDVEELVKLRYQRCRVYERESRVKFSHLDQSVRQVVESFRPGEKSPTSLEDFLEAVDKTPGILSAVETLVFLGKSEDMTKPSRKSVVEIETSEHERANA